MQFSIITLLPELFAPFKKYGVVGRAITSGTVDVSLINPRDFSEDENRRVDDRPYGGGPGMVLKPGPLISAVEAANRESSGFVVYLSPQGMPLTHKIVCDLASKEKLVLIAGRYEGVDERVVEQVVDMEISIGDYVLSGGELPSMVLMDAVIRMQPGVLGHAESAESDSFVEGLLDHPHYTRPPVFNGRSVPNILISGDHEKIKVWRHNQALERTKERRADLYERYIQSHKNGDSEE